MLGGGAKIFITKANSRRKKYIKGGGEMYKWGTLQLTGDSYHKIGEGGRIDEIGDNFVGLQGLVAILAFITCGKFGKIAMIVTHHLVSCKRDCNSSTAELKVVGVGRGNVVHE